MGQSINHSSIARQSGWLASNHSPSNHPSIQASIQAGAPLLLLNHPFTLSGVAFFMASFHSSSFTLISDSLLSLSPCSWTSIYRGSKRPGHAHTDCDNRVVHCIRPLRRPAAHVLPLQAQSVEKERRRQGLRNGLGASIDCCCPTESGTTTVLPRQRARQQGPRALNGSGTQPGGPEDSVVCDPEWIFVSSW